MDYKEKLKATINSDKTPIVDINTLLKYFPELAESEDERIRKELLKIAKESEDSFYMVMTPNKRKHLIAWLEKQSEKKPSDNIESSVQNKPWSKEDEEMFNEIILDLKALKNRDTGEAGKAAYQREIDWLESLKSQSQWKPSEEQMKALEVAIRSGIQLGSWEEDSLKSLARQLMKLRKE